MSMMENFLTLPKTRAEKQQDRTRRYLGSKTTSNLDKYSEMRYHLVFTCNRDLDFMDAAENSQLFQDEWSRYEAFLLSSVVTATAVDPTSVDVLVPPIETAIPTTKYELVVEEAPSFTPVQISQSILCHPMNSRIHGRCVSNQHVHLPKLFEGLCSGCGSSYSACICYPQCQVAQGIQSPPAQLSVVDVVNTTIHNVTDSQVCSEDFITSINILLNNNYIQCSDYLKIQRAYSNVPPHRCAVRRKQHYSVSTYTPEKVFETTAGNCICSTMLGKIYPYISDCLLLWMKHLNNRILWCSEFKKKSNWKSVRIKFEREGFIDYSASLITD